MNWEDELYRHHGPLGLPFHFWTLFIGIFGAMTGSFLNVVIHRMPREESIVHPPSHCPTCNHRIPMWQNMPIFSWLMLRGRCASCRTAISPRYIGVEALTGAVCRGVVVLRRIGPVGRRFGVHFVGGICRSHLH